MRASVDPDELVLAAIIAAGVSSGRDVVPTTRQRGLPVHGLGYVNDRRGATPYKNLSQYSCCAVGAGLIYVGIDEETSDPRGDLAARLGVSAEYVAGINDGFEGGGAFWSTYFNFDYERGHAVGNAVYEYFHGDDGPRGRS